MYRGGVSVSASGSSCINWQSTNYSNEVAPQSQAFCRNPNGTRDKPWCITSLTSYQWESCNVPKCVRPTITNANYPLGSK